MSDPAAPPPDAVPIRFEVHAAFHSEGHGTVAAGELAAGELRAGDPLEWVRGDATRATRCVGVAVIREDPPREPPLTGVLVEGLAPDDLAPGDVLRSPGGVLPQGMALAVDGPEVNVFEAVGGRPFFDRLVDRFYAGVAGDPVIRPLYPDDLTDSITHTAGFLAQYWGGGTVQYSDERGHPRLRMRHGHVAIGQAERDRWVHHMTEAVHEERLPAELEAKLLAYFEMGASAMVNSGH